MLYVARDKNGALWLYTKKPQRQIEVFASCGNSEHDDALKLNPYWFPDLEWEDEPIEVKLVEL